jgi:hypothetical protein
MNTTLKIEFSNGLMRAVTFDDEGHVADIREVSLSNGCGVKEALRVLMNHCVSDFTEEGDEFYYYLRRSEAKGHRR